MGCTSSRQVGNNASSPPPARSINIGSGGHADADIDPSSSSQTIVNHAAAPSNTGRSPRRTSRSRQHNNLATTTADGRPNHPIRAPSPVFSCPSELTLRPWAPSELQRQREAFFDTRVTGSPEVWAALKLACDMLRAGDIAGAQGVLDATDLTCPTGRVASERHSSRRGNSGKKGGIYDNKGVLYDVPAWIVADPEDLVEEDKTEEQNEKLAALNNEVEEARIEEDGKEKEEVKGEMVKVRARLSGREMDVIVSVGSEQKVGVVVAKIKEKANVRALRLAHLGKMLGENEKLCETGWAPGHVLNAFVFE